jgi:hypothetical protein
VSGYKPISNLKDFHLKNILKNNIKAL